MKKNICVLIALFMISQPSLAGLRDAAVQNIYGDGEIVRPTKTREDDAEIFFIYLSMAICRSKEDPNMCFLPFLNKYIQDMEEK